MPFVLFRLLYNVVSATHKTYCCYIGQINTTKDKAAENNTMLAFVAIAALVLAIIALILHPCVHYRSLFACAQRFWQHVCLSQTDHNNTNKDVDPNPCLMNLVIVFTDIEGSTMLQEHTSTTTSARLARRHSTIANNCASLHNGRVVKGLGDGFLAVFYKCCDACAFAAAYQALCATTTWPAGIHEAQRRISAEIASSGFTKHPLCRSASAASRLQVKVGIHVGLVAVEEAVNGSALVGDLSKLQDVHGITVSKAARVTALAQGGQILVTGDVLQNIRENLVLDTSVPSPSCLVNDEEERVVFDKFVCSSRGVVHLRGSAGATLIYELTTAPTKHEKTRDRPHSR